MVGEWWVVSLSMPPLSMHAKLTGTSFFPLLLFSLMPVSHSHASFQGRGEKRQINKISFQSLCSQRELAVQGAGKGALRSLWLAIENCCPYRERSVYTICKVKQIDPGWRFRSVFVWLPVNLPTCHLQSLSQFLIRPLFLSPPSRLVCVLGVCVCICLCLCCFVNVLLRFPCGFQACIQRST